MSAALFQNSAKTKVQETGKNPLHIKYEYDVSGEKADRGMVNQLTKQRKSQT